MPYAYIENEEIIAIPEGAPFEYNDVQYPPGVFDYYTPEELSDIGVYRIQVGDVPLYQSGTDGLVFEDDKIIKTFTVDIVQVRAVMCSKVNTLRDTKIDGGYLFMGYKFQSAPSDRENIIGAAQAASLAISQGAGPGNLRWADPNNDFGWITADNDIVPMDAFTVIGLFQKGLGFKQSITFYARYLKDAINVSLEPETININDGWPE